MALLLFVAGGAAAQSAWSGSGNASLSSTPSPYGPCTGSGTAQLSLSGTSSSLYGTLTLDFTSYSSGCAGGGFSTGSVEDSVQGHLSGDQLVLSDSYGDTISGTLSGDSLNLALTEPPPTPPSGGSCAAYCHTVINTDMTGTGDISGAGGLGSLNFADQSTVVATVGLGFGLVGIGLGGASLAARGSRSPGGSSALQSAGRGGFGGHSAGGAVGPRTSVNPQYAPAPLAMVGNPPPAPPTTGVPEGQPVTGGGAGFGGGFTPSPQIYVNYTFWWSVNGWPINPETGLKADIRPGPDGPRQYWNQTTGKYYHQLAP